MIVDERPHGEFSRQLFLGDNLDTAKVTANVEIGVLTLTLPVAEGSKPRRVQVGASNRQKIGASQKEPANANSWGSDDESGYGRTTNAASVRDVRLPTCAARGCIVHPI